MSFFRVEFMRTGRSSQAGCTASDSIAHERRAVMVAVYEVCCQNRMPAPNQKSTSQATLTDRASASEARRGLCEGTMMFGGLKSRSAEEERAEVDKEG